MDSRAESDVLKPIQENKTSLTLSNSTKRLTMVEKARLEALASFGNEGLDSMPVKKIDFSSKLKSTTPKTEKKTSNARPLTKMQRANIEANDAFGNVMLGQLIRNPKKRKIQDTDQNENSKKQRQNTVTRLQKAKQEVEKAFENVSLDKIPKKKSKLEKEKLERKLLEGRKDSKPTTRERKAVRIQSPLPESTPVLKSCKASEMLTGMIDPAVRSVGTNTPKRLTRSHSANMEVLKSFNGLEAENSSENNYCRDSVEVDMETAHDNIAPQSHQENNISSAGHEDNGCKTLSRIERAKLETLQSFSCQEFRDICKQSSRIVAKHLKPKKDKSCNTENQELCHTPSHVNEAQDIHEKSPHFHCSLLSRSETPDAALQTHGQLEHKRPRVDVYSSILEGNFKDQSSLLETSRRVVMTAVQLETPERSPTCASTS